MVKMFKSGEVFTNNVDEIGPKEGLVAYWPLDDNIEYPDNESGTDYLWDSWPDTGGWGYGAGTTGSVETLNGKLRDYDLTPNSSTQYKLVRSSTPYDGKFFSAKVRVSGGQDPTEIKYYNGSAYVNFPNMREENGWWYVWGILSSTTSTMYFNIYLSNIPAWIEYDFIYIGDGTYSSTVQEVQSGFNGTIHGSPQFVKGVAGGALEFDGVDDYVSVSENHGITLDQKSFSISAWFYKMVNDENFYVGKHSAENDDESLHFGIRETTNKPTMDFFRDGVTGASGILLQKWYHIVATFDFDTKVQKIYIDGVLDGESISDGEHGGLYGTDDDPLTIGWWERDSYKGEGRIAGLRIYNRSLTLEEIKTLYLVK